MSLLEAVAAGLLVLGSCLVVQVALTDRFDPRQRRPQPEPRDGEEPSTWRRAA